MYGKDIWFGKEVEGRYSDIETVFIRKGKLPDNHVIGIYPHIYFTIEYIKEAIKNNNWSDIHLVLDCKKIVTIEATAETFEAIPMSVFNRVHIIYRIPDKFVEKLKSTDTLSIDAGWYRVEQITKYNMQKITPDSYKFDYL